MIRVMVVEDEPPIQRSICQKITSLNPNFEITATADNGKDAIAWLSTHEVDVMFVDINLPLVSGLEVLDYVRENDIRLIPVVLSGYKDFEYVRSAFSNHVLDYLLKPLKEKELEILLEKIEKIYRKFRFEESAQELKEALVGQKTETGKEQVYCMMLLIFGNSGGLAVDELNITSLYQAMDLEGILSSMILDGAFWIINGKQINEKLVFIRKDGELPIHKLNRIPGELRGRRIPLTAVYNRDPVKVQEIYGFYRQMRDYAREHMIFAKDTILMFSENALKPESRYHKMEIDDMIGRCRQSPGAGGVFGELQRLLVLLTERPVRYKDAVHDLKYFISRLCQELPGRREYFELEDSLQFIFENCYTVEEIEEEFQFLIKNMFDAGERGTKDKMQLVNQIKEYLDANYRKNITNQMLAVRFGFVASYLSSIFKEYYKTTPSDYMVHKRMEEARYLLASGEEKIKDVAAAVGYEDPLYFSKVFKRYAGVSPKEFVAGKETVRRKE